VQEPQFSPFDSENLTPAERRALRRARARRVQAFALGVGACALALFAIGCPQPADLANPQDYPAAAGTTTTGGGATAGTGGTAPAGEPCETACMKEVFQTNQTLCKLCHNNMGLKSAMLDLSSDGYTARLKNVSATHTDLGMGMTAADCPTGDKLIDTTTPANSWLLKKIHNEQGNCGTVMPSTGTLSPAQKTCIETYVACVAPGGAAPSGGTSSGGAASAGTSSGGAASAGTASGGSGGAKGGSGGTGGA
jgi:hypothetical protein